jgi:hypothetical protein
MDKELMELSQKLNGRQAATDDARPLLRGELRTLSAQIAAVAAKAADRTTRLHLDDARDQIAKILDPKFAPAAPSAATAASPFRRGFEEEPELNCWPDYAVRRGQDSVSDRQER